ncbi:MAG TPA: type III-B CRISPR module RAMP protein Cmr6 [Bacteroidales bacterium]|nr:type III-B CRISPR module RAMP protein Cmr6 [Bacteroidales bacterium]
MNSTISLQNDSFPLQIAYPGLVTGVGIDHEAKIEGEFKLGVHFDYTWGMPVVYGSSVKGVLRAYFKDFYQGGNDKPNAEYLFYDIFEGRNMAKEHQLNDDKKYYKSIYDRDIFFDAVITEADSKERILCSDSITPHGDNPLRNPTPLTFLKIAAGCTMEFRFKLVDTKDENGDVIFSKDNKKELFEEIIKTVGIGAKTNVGYGQFQ